MLANTCKLTKILKIRKKFPYFSCFIHILPTARRMITVFGNFSLSLWNMKLDSKTLWNEAGRVGLVFGGFSSLCLVLKEGAALTGSMFLVQAAAIILWAVEFFGCILLMKKYMLDLRDKFDGVTMEDTYRFGRRVGLLSGLILASVDAFLIMKLPQDTVADVVNELTSSVSAQLGSSYAGQVEQVVDRLPLYTFIFQWLYCFLYGSLLSGILSRYIFLQNNFQDGGDNGDGNDLVDIQ